MDSLQYVLSGEKERFRKLLGVIEGKDVFALGGIHGFPISNVLKEWGAPVIQMDFKNYGEGVPFPESCMDIVVSENLISAGNPFGEYMADPRKFFQETLHILRPRGHYISNDFSVEPTDLQVAGFVDIKPIFSEQFLYGRKP
ncbi:hypothetical protein ACFLZB_02355 [Nanoarchaeota archaeon]